jgi:lipopolysaccharide transport system ATP-binding protein
MYMRLAFAVAAHLDPEVLIVDEVLAVGDMAFQKKCTGKLGNVSREGRTVFFVSHNMAAIEGLCSTCLLLEKGHLVRQGAPQEIINCYLQTILPSADEGTSLADDTARTGNGKLRLTSFHIEDIEGNTLRAVRNGMDFKFVFGFRCIANSPRNVDVGFSVHSLNDVTLFGLYRSYTAAVFPVVPHSGEFRCLVENFPLLPGRYRVHARVTVAGEEADWPRNGVGYIDVESGDFYGTGSIGFTDGPSMFMMNGKWEVD